MADTRRYCGQVIAGGIRDNVWAALEISSELLSVGSYLVVSGRQREYLALVVDVKHPNSDPRLGSSHIPAVVRDFLISQAAAPVAELQLLLALEKSVDGRLHLRPARELPVLYAQTYVASAEDIHQVFNLGSPDAAWTIGYLREQGYPIQVDLQRLVQRSTGVFGATGSGKSFLTRLLLAGLLKQQLGAALILDMHNEFGFDDTASDDGLPVKGLKSLSPERVTVVGLKNGGSIRGHLPDLEIQIGTADIQPEDVLLLNDELALTDTSMITLSRLVDEFGRDYWLDQFIKIGTKPGEGSGEGGQKAVETWAGKHGLHPKSASAMFRKLLRVYNRSYITPNPGSGGWRAILPILQRGDHVILSFGRYKSDLDYLLVANLLGRSISTLWQQETDRYRSQQGEKPKPLVIVVEEAHKFLRKEVASQTVFDVLARELRKSYCVVWVVDQRPSKIYDEVLSQLGTRLSGWLGDENDVKAVVTGLPGKDNLKTLLSSLEPRGEALLVGWGLPAPITIRTRSYQDMVREEFPEISNG
jgi:DNA helicase HerA-like ATPase